MDQPWTRRPRPDRLERRIEFDDYERTRTFLERLNGLSEQEGRFPDISFGRTYVNLTLRSEAEDGALGEAEMLFAAAIDALTIAQRFERIADMTTNIAEDVIFLVEGRIVRHEAPETGG
jgi:4a-hydroxytetrahydrobiopterin dehydratase